MRTTEDKKDRVIRVRVNEETERMIKEYSRSRRISSSEVIREAIKFFLVQELEK